MTASRFACLALYSKACVEKPIQILKLLPRLVRSDIRGLCFRDRPRHRHVGVFLTGWRCYDQRRVFELRAVERENILDDQVRRVSMFAVDVLLDVETDDEIALGKQALSPAAKAAKEIDGEWLTHLARGK